MSLRLRSTGAGPGWSNRGVETAQGTTLKFYSSDMTITAVSYDRPHILNCDNQ